MTRTHTLALAVALVASVTAACGGSGGDAGGDSATVRVAYMADVHGAGIVAVGNDQGFWDKAGVKVDAKRFEDGPTEIQAMAGGDVDIAYIGPGAAWLPASGRGTIVTVDSLNIGDYVIGRPGISSLKDLKGKKVGYPEGTSGEMILRLALDRAGLSMSDIQATPLTPDAEVPAFVGGQIDVAAIWAPLSEQIRSRVPDAKFLVGDKDFSDQYQFPQTWVASTTFVKEHPDLLRKFLKGFILSNDYRASNLDAAVRATSKYTKVPVDVLTAQARTTTWLPSKKILDADKNGDAKGWLTKLAGMFRTMGKLKGDPVESYVDWSAYQKAADEVLK